MRSSIANSDTSTETKMNEMEIRIKKKRGRPVGSKTGATSSISTKRRSREYQVFHTYCRFCFVDFPSLAHFANHCLKRHDLGTPASIVPHYIMCGACQLTMEKPEDFFRHLETYGKLPARFGKFIPCPVCNFSIHFQGERNWMYHLSMEHQQELTQLACPIAGCSVVFSELDSARVASHLYESHSRCRLCRMKAKKRRGLKKQQQQGSQNPNETCPKCLRLMKNENEMDEPILGFEIQIEREKKAQEIPQPQAKPAVIANAATVTKRQPKKPILQRCFQCIVCGYLSYKERSVFDHKIAVGHHEGNSVPYDMIVVTSVFACETCGDTFPHQGSLRVHRSCCRQDEKRVVYECDDCILNFETYRELSIHQMMHGLPQDVVNDDVVVNRNEFAVPTFYCCAECYKLTGSIEAYGRHERKCKKQRDAANVGNYSNESKEGLKAGKDDDEDDEVMDKNGENFARRPIQHAYN